LEVFIPPFPEKSKSHSQFQCRDRCVLFEPCLRPDVAPADDRRRIGGMD
jgi:hypothetical protein